MITETGEQYLRARAAFDAIARVEALCVEIDNELDAIAETYGVETTTRVTERIRAALRGAS